MLTERKDVEAVTVAAIEPGSPAADSGLRVGDSIESGVCRFESGPSKQGESTESGEKRFYNLSDMRPFLVDAKERGLASSTVQLVLTVKRDGKAETLPPLTLSIPKDPWKIDFGFTMNDCTVGTVDPDSAAHQKGLRRADVITRINDQPINFRDDFFHYLSQGKSWPRGLNDLRITVVRGNGEPETLPQFEPRTLGLHPTQLYESVSMALLFLVLTAYYPLRRRDGMVMVLFTLGYSLHRFLNEMLRNDTEIVRIGNVSTHMTLSQNGSIFFFLVGLLLLVWLWRKPAQYRLTSS